MQYEWFGMLGIMNCTKDTLHVISNVVSCEQNDLLYGFSGDKFDIPPGRVVLIAQTNYYTDENMITIENMIDNYDKAFITVSSEVNGSLYLRTWNYENRNNDGKQIFNLSDSHLEYVADYHKRFCLTYKYYTFSISEEDILEP